MLAMLRRILLGPDNVVVACHCGELKAQVVDVADHVAIFRRILCMACGCYTRAHLKLVRDHVEMQQR